MSDGKMVHVHLLDQANERALLLERELAQIKQGWAEDDARLLRAEEGWAEASERLAQVKADHDAAHEIKDAWIAEAKEAEAERDTALRERDEAVENVAALLRDVDQLPWIPDSFRIGWRFLARLGWSSLDEPPAPAVSGTPDTKEDA